MLTDYNSRILSIYFALYRGALQLIRISVLQRLDFTSRQRNHCGQVRSSNILFRSKELVISFVRFRTDEVKRHDCKGLIQCITKTTGRTLSMPLVSYHTM